MSLVLSLQVKMKEMDGFPVQYVLTKSVKDFILKQRSIRLLCSTDQEFFMFAIYIPLNIRYIAKELWGRRGNDRTNQSISW